MGTSNRDMVDGAARTQLNADLAALHCRVHDPGDPPLFTREPQSSMQPCHWRWRDLWPLLQRLGQELAIGSGGQRRTLRLAPPGLPYGTTPTFWGSIQVVMPGEVAAAHRHTANAFRWITHGGTGITTSTVNGERCVMSQGDLVLTPAMTWHDHEYHGEEPMVWLDGLDISLMRSLHACFFDPYPEAKQPVLESGDGSSRQWASGMMRPPGVQAPAVNPLLLYPRARSEEALAAAASQSSDPCDDTILEFCNPATGGAAMTTLGMCLQRLRPGFVGRPRRHTGSKLYQVVRGQGVTVVAGMRFEWEQGDYFVIPPWAWHEHANASGTEEAVLFHVNDFPTLRALGYYREELAPAAGLS